MAGVVSTYKECLRHLKELQDGSGSPEAAAEPYAQVASKCNKLQQEQRNPPAKATWKKLVLEMQVPFYAAAACRAATQPGAANPLAHAAACTVLKTILQSASCAGVFKPQLGSQDTSSNLAVSMLQQLQDAGLMQQLRVSLWIAVEDLRDALVMSTLGSPMLHAHLNRAADMLTITEHVILLHQGLPAVLQAHAVLAPAAFALIAAAMRYLSVHLPGLQQQQQQGQQQQQEQPTDQKVLLLKGTEVVLAAEQFVATLGKCVFAFGGISGALRAVPRLQQLVDCPHFVPFLVLQLAVVSQGLLQPLQELRATAAAKGSGSRRGRRMLHTRRSNSSSCSGSNASNPSNPSNPSSSSSNVSTSVTTEGEQPLELLQQLQQQQRLPPTTPCQQRLFDLLGVDSITLAWASQRATHSTTYFQGLLRLYREVVNEQHGEEEEEEEEEEGEEEEEWGEEVEEKEEEEGEEEEEQQQDEGAATQWQLHLLLPAVLLPCAARLCKSGSATAAALGLSMADQALLCRNIARASSASLHVWQSQCGVAGGSRSTLDELQLLLGELRSLLLQVLHQALHAMPQRRQDELRLRLVSLEAPADTTPARRAAAAAFFAGLSAAAADSALAPSIDVFADAAVAVAAPDVAGTGTESGVGAASTAQLQEDLQCRMVVEMAEPWEDWMHAAAELMGRLLLLLGEQEDLDGLVQQQDRAAAEQQQQQARASLAGPGEDGAAQQQHQAEGSPAGPGVGGVACCSAAAGQQQQEQQHQAEGSPAGPGMGGAACCSAAAGRQQQQQQCSSQGGVSGGGVSRPLAPALSVPAQLPFLCATFERLVRVVAAAITAEGLDVYNASQATKNALTVLGSSCAVGSGCRASHRGSDLHQGVLTLAVQEAGLGQAGGRQFYSFLCSFVKLCYGFNKQTVLDKGVMWNPFRPACTALHAMVREGEESDSAPTLDALPSVFIIGRCCLLWADILSAQTENGELALQESSQQQLRSFTHDYFKGLCYTAETWLPPRSAQLSAAGYPDPDSWLQQVRAVEAAAAAAQQAEAEAVAAQGAALVQELRALGGASCLFAVPLFCNNPRCMSLHGETEVSLVSGRACVCSGCRVARYCGRECLRQHWKQHKPVCKALAAAAAGARAPDGDAATAPAAL